MIAPPAIEVKNLTVLYNEGTPNEVVGLDNVSVSIPKGSTVVITGGNGSGKSTFLKAIAGTVPAKSGQIFINGTDVTRWPAHRRAKELSFVHQDPMLGTCPSLTVHENFMLSDPRPWWLPMPYPTVFPKAAHDLLDKTGLPLDEKHSTRLSLLSGGQRQALAVCLAFYGNRRTVALLDEFTSALDKETKMLMLSLVVSEVKSPSMTMLMITHDHVLMKQLEDYTPIYFDAGEIRGEF